MPNFEFKDEQVSNFDDKKSYPKREFFEIKENGDYIIRLAGPYDEAGNFAKRVGIHFSIPNNIDEFDDRDYLQSKIDLTAKPCLEETNNIPCPICKVLQDWKNTPALKFHQDRNTIFKNLNPKVSYVFNGLVIDTPNGKNIDPNKFVLIKLTPRIYEQIKKLMRDKKFQVGGSYSGNILSRKYGRDLIITRTNNGRVEYSIQVFNSRPIDESLMSTIINLHELYKAPDEAEMKKLEASAHQYRLYLTKLQEQLSQTYKESKSILSTNDSFSPPAIVNPNHITKPAQAPDCFGNKDEFGQRKCIVCVFEDECAAVIRATKKAENV